MSWESPARAPEELTDLEADVVTAMLGAAIEEARRRGLDLMGIDHPALNVLAAITSWVIAARGYKPVLAAPAQKAGAPGELT